MQFIIPAATLLAFVSGTLGQVAGFDTITQPETGEVLAAGETYTVVWEAAPAEYDDETIAIFLMGGETAKTLIPDEEPFASGIVNSVGSYEWAVPLSLGDQDVYGLRIQLESNAEVFQYSFPFHIEASDDVPTNSTEPTVTATDDTSSTEAPETTPSSNATATEPPSTTLTTATDEPSSEPEEPEDQDPGSGAAAHGAMGTVAFVGALAAAMFAL